MNNEAGAILAREKMSWLQVAGIGLCALLNGLDGFDVLSIAFASPGIAKEWHIQPAALGIVLSMELIGMAVGSIGIGALADRWGRRPAILLCLVVMAVFMFAAAMASNVESLLAFRFLTGLGIGGMLASTNAMTAELANDRRRDLAVAIMAGGYPVGAALGGTIVSMLLVHGTWRNVFIFGGTMTAILLPITFLLLPESIGFLSRKGGADALARVNRILARMGHSPADGLGHPARPVVPVAALFAPGLAVITVLLTILYFCHILTFYYILKWLPKIVVNMGFPASSAAGVLVWANVGGAAGAFLLSFIILRFDTRKVVIGAFLLSAVLVSLFGWVRPELGQISLVAGAAGICTNGAIAGIYALIAKLYPAEVRAGGTGFVIGLGRGGAALGPVIAGILFQSGASLAAVSMAMASGSLVAAIALFCLGSRPAASR